MLLLIFHIVYCFLLSLFKVFRSFAFVVSLRIPLECLLHVYVMCFAVIIFLFSLYYIWEVLKTALKSKDEELKRKRSIIKIFEHYQSDRLDNLKKRN